MKKIFYILLTAIVLIPGCGKYSSSPGPEFDDQSGAYIFFDPEVINTKGTLISTETLPAEPDASAFGVFGVRENGEQIFNMYAATPSGQQIESSFDNVAVMYRPEVNSAFIYDALALWTKGKHSFYAYYPYDNPKTDVITEIQTSSRPYITYIQPIELDEMVDVMTAAALEKTSADEDAQPVKLNFNHRLFAFDIIINNKQSESSRNLRVLNSTVEFINVAAGANLYFDDGSDEDTTADIMLGSEMHQMITHTFADPVTIEAPVEDESLVEYNYNETSSFLFLPCEELQVVFTMTFLNAWDEECSFEVSNTIIPAGGFLPGHKYALVINKSDHGQEMVFTTSVRQWDSFDDIDIEFH